MTINTDLSTDPALASRQNPRSATGATGSPNSTAATGSLAASQLDPSLQRLADVPAGTQDAEWEIQSEQGASQAMDFLRQSMTSQPAMAMTAQANQISQNVLNLLQSTD